MWIILWAVLLYVVCALIWNAVGVSSIGISWRGTLKWLVFNQPIVITNQMWFLFALLYVYIVYLFIEKWGLQKIAYAMIPMLFVVYIFMAQGMHLIGVSIPNYIYRNWLVEGLPFFMLGHYIHYKGESCFLLKCSNKVYVWTILLATILCVVERYLLGRDFGVNIFTFPQVTVMFCLAIKNPHFGKGVIQKIGKNYSMFVYVLHPAAWRFLELLYETIKINENIVALYIEPIFVCVIKLLLSLLVYQCNHSLFNRRDRRLRGTNDGTNYSNLR